jgi:uncharacterized hydrophobic protein (TIGR00271 family)
VLHVRVVCPPSLTPTILEIIRAQAGVTNVTLHSAVVVQPVGDIVTGDVAREAASELLGKLRAAGTEEQGSVILADLDTALGKHVDLALQASPRLEDDALIWEELEAATGEESTQSVTYLVFLAIAILIAAVGLLTDSPILIVGAMVLGPEFGPLAGLAVAAKRRNTKRALESLRAVVVGFALGIVVTAAGVALLRAAGEVPAAYLRGDEPLTSFVSHPNVYSVIVALLAGVAGTLSLTAAKSTALVGVFISVTTVPAAAGIATAAVTGRYSDAWGASVQLIVNLLCIIAAAFVTLSVSERLTHSQPQRD